MTGRIIDESMIWRAADWILEQLAWAGDESDGDGGSGGALAAKSKILRASHWPRKSAPTGLFSIS
jgi:hypothetical protein